jgi:hypothetical protein
LESCITLGGFRVVFTLSYLLFSILIILQGCRFGGSKSESGDESLGLDFVLPLPCRIRSFQSQLFYRVAALVEANLSQEMNH